MRESIVSGIRPTGRLHIGHLIGVINNWKLLQEKYNCFFMVADLHALTTEYNNVKEIRNYTYEMVLDLLSCGIDPSKSTIFCQSDVESHCTLHLIFSMLTPLGWLYSCPTYKEQLKEQSSKDLKTYGFLGYPVLQAADILLYRATKVPIGKDQLPHIELTREIARKFNLLYSEYFKEPEPLLTEFPYLPGIDGRKMSKSYGNCIFLNDDNKTIRKKVSMMFTDPKRIHKTDPGDPTNCVVYAFHKIFNPDYKKVENLCKTGKLGCVEDKDNLTKILENVLLPIQERRKGYDLNKAKQILTEGKNKALEVANKTIAEIKNIIGLGI